jgi:2-oxoglutarate dehydrogenase E2 component (dihydrolipoamide succinyltransferase)
MVTDILVPFEQEGTKAVVRSWLKKIGDPVAENDPLVELETDKVTQEIASPAAGVLSEILLDTDNEALPGAILGRVGPAFAAVMSEVEIVSPKMLPPDTSAVQHSSALLGLSPAVRRAVVQHNIDPETILGTGRGGRLTRADVDAAVAERGREGAAKQALPTSVTLRETGGVRAIPHDRMRLAIAANMLNSVTIAPHVTAVFEADFSAIMAHRRKHKPAYEKEGIGLTFTAYLIAACVEAMRAAPAINGRWFDDRLEIYDAINIGVGTSLGEKGLIVPVVQGAQELSLRGIATRLGDLTNRARAEKLTSADVRGGTFTISNHGVSGSLFATPIIIAQPQSAILGVGKLEKRVVVREVECIDTIQIRPMCFVSLTIDHRVVDGHQTNAWLSKFVEVLESWPIDG